MGVRAPALAVAVSLALAGAVHAGEASLLARCWSDAELKGGTSDRVVVRRSAPVDMAALRSAVPGNAGAPGPDLGGSIRRVELPPDKRLLALTFDLCEASGETAGYDGGVVDYLRAEGVRATFFAGGKWMASHPERTQQLMADPLFEIASHGWSHRDMRHLAPDALRDEIALAAAAHARARDGLAARACAAGADAELARVPDRMRLFRFPYGACDARSLDAVAAAGFVAVQWDVVTGDPAPGQSARAIAAAILSQARPGSIVVAHANGRGWNTAAALPLVVPTLRARGFEFVTVSELLAAGRPVAAGTCYETRPGDRPAQVPGATASRSAPAPAPVPFWSHFDRRD